MSDQTVYKFTVAYNSMVGDLFNYQFGQMHRVVRNGYFASYQAELYDLFDSFERAYTKRFAKYVKIVDAISDELCPVYLCEYGRQLYIKTNYSPQKWSAPRSTPEFDPQATHDVFWRTVMKKTTPFKPNGNIAEIRGFIYDNYKSLTMKLIESYYRRDDFMLHVDLREGEISLAYVDLISGISLERRGELRVSAHRETIVGGDALTVSFFLKKQDGREVEEPLAHFQVHEKKIGKRGGQGRDTVILRLNVETLKNLVTSGMIRGVTCHTTYMDSRAEIKSLCGREGATLKRKLNDDISDFGRKRTK